MFPNPRSDCSAARSDADAMVGVVVRADEQDAIARALARDEVQHFQRRGVRPLQVLENEEQRALCGKAREKLREVPEEARLELSRISARGRRGAMIRVERGEQLHQLRGAAAGQQREHRRVEGS